MITVDLPFLGRGAANFANSAAQFAVVTTAAYIDTHAKQGFQVTAHGRTDDPLGVTFTPVGAIGLGMHLTDGYRDAGIIAEFLSGGVKKYALVREQSFYPSSSSYHFSKWYDGAWVSVVACGTSIGECRRFDLFLDLTTGTFSCHIEGVEVAAVTEAPIASSIDRINFLSPYATYSSVIIREGTTLSWVNEERQVIGIGDLTGWFGPTSNVSGLGVNDATAINAQNAGQTRSFILSSPDENLEFTHVPSMVSVSARGAAGETETVRELIIGTSDGTTVDDTADPETLGVSVTPVVRNFAIDWDGLLWTASSLAELQPIIKAQ